MRFLIQGALNSTVYRLTKLVPFHKYASHLPSRDIRVKIYLRENIYINTVGRSRSGKTDGEKNKRTTRSFLESISCALRVAFANSLYTHHVCIICTREREILNAVLITLRGRRKNVKKCEPASLYAHIATEMPSRSRHISGILLLHALRVYIRIHLYVKREK